MANLCRDNHSVQSHIKSLVSLQGQLAGRTVVCYISNIAGLLKYLPENNLDLNFFKGGFLHKPQIFSFLATFTQQFMIQNCPSSWTSSVAVGQYEAFLPHSDQLPDSQQSDGGGLHVVYTLQPHSEWEGWREGRWDAVWDLSLTLLYILF